MDSADQLGDVLDTLNTEHGFEPPTDPRLRFSRKGGARLEGYLSGTNAWVQDLGCRGAAAA